MSQENVEIVREFFAASHRRDTEGALALLDPEVEWDATRLPLPLPRRIFRGHSGWREFWSEVYEDMSDVRYQIEEFRGAGEQVLAIAHGTGRGRRSGATSEFRQFLLYGLRNGRIVRMCAYVDKREALEAAGLSG
jgi:ketosteroid isomerase-like protein